MAFTGLSLNKLATALGITSPKSFKAANNNVASFTQMSDFYAEGLNTITFGLLVAYNSEFTVETTFLNENPKFTFIKNKARNFTYTNLGTNISLVSNNGHRATFRNTYNPGSSTVFTTKQRCSTTTTQNITMTYNDGGFLNGVFSNYNTPINTSFTLVSPPTPILTSNTINLVGPPQPCRNSTGAASTKAATGCFGAQCTFQYGMGTYGPTGGEITSSYVDIYIRRTDNFGNTRPFDPISSANNGYVYHGRRFSAGSYTFSNLYGEQQYYFYLINEYGCATTEFAFSTLGYR